MQEFPDFEDGELSFFLSTLGPDNVMLLVCSLASELEAGDFESYFLNPSGADIFACASILDRTHLNKDSPTSRLLWEAMTIIGLSTRWHDPNARALAISTLSIRDREHLRQLGKNILDCLYKEDIVTDC